MACLRNKCSLPANGEPLESSEVLCKVSEAAALRGGDGDEGISGPGEKEDVGATGAAVGSSGGKELLGSRITQWEVADWSEDMQGPSVPRQQFPTEDWNTEPAAEDWSAAPTQFSDPSNLERGKRTCKP
ncbi:hypothetical protein GH733_006520 [Mirounga leonina]|nr:hypothetical protein GH733_006520 [Mirounga leonina]